MKLLRLLALGTLLSSLGLGAYLLLSPTPKPLPLVTDPGETAVVPLCGGSPATPWTKHTIYNAILGTDGVEVFDVDGDGDLDVASPWEQGARGTLSLNPGPANVRTTSPWTTGEIVTLTAQEGIGFGDGDEDGRTDLCATSQAGTVVVRFGPASNDDWTTPAAWGGPMTLTGLPAGVGWMECKFVDVDGDSETDIVLGGTTGGATGELGWVKGPAAGKRTAANWTPYTTIETSGRIMTLEIVDWAGDGSANDIFASTRLSPGVGTFWQQNNNTGTFTRRNISDVTVFMMASYGDFDDDGDMDVCNGSDTTLIKCWANMDSDGVDAVGEYLDWRQTVIIPPSTFGVHQATAIGDINKDLYPDVVITAFDATTGLSGIVWMDGFARTWVRNEIQGADAFTSKFDRPRLVDLDNDGDLDVIAGDQGDEDGVQEGDEGLHWWENPCLQ